MKFKKKHIDFALDIGMTVALMSGEGRMDALYKIIHEDLDIGGICDTAYTMSWFATEFADLYKDVNWEDVFDDSKKIADIFKYRSKEFKEKYGEYVGCWDEAVEDYAQWRIEGFNAEEFGKINYGREENPMLKVKECSNCKGMDLHLDEQCSECGRET